MRKVIFYFLLSLIVIVGVGQAQQENTIITFLPDIVIVTATLSTGVNLRSSPEISNNIAAVTSGDSLTLVGYEDKPDGRWYKTSEGVWIRSDVAGAINPDDETLLNLSTSDTSPVNAILNIRVIETDGQLGDSILDANLNVNEISQIVNSIVDNPVFGLPSAIFTPENVAIIVSQYGYIFIQTQNVYDSQTEMTISAQSVFAYNRNETGEGQPVIGFFPISQIISLAQDGGIEFTGDVTVTNENMPNGYVVYSGSSGNQVMLNWVKATVDTSTMISDNMIILSQDVTSQVTFITDGVIQIGGAYYELITGDYSMRRAELNPDFVPVRIVDLDLYDPTIPDLPFGEIDLNNSNNVSVLASNSAFNFLWMHHHARSDVNEARYINAIIMGGVNTRTLNLTEDISIVVVNVQLPALSQGAVAQVQDLDIILATISRTNQRGCVDNTVHVGVGDFSRFTGGLFIREQSLSYVQEQVLIPYNSIGIYQAPLRAELSCQPVYDAMDNWAEASSNRRDVIYGNILFK